MVFLSGYKQNFGAQSDDPRSAVSWEQQYEKLMASASGEELRKKFSGMGWSADSEVAPTPEK
jgi:hypothetical protein